LEELFHFCVINYILHVIQVTGMVHWWKHFGNLLHQRNGYCWIVYTNWPIVNLLCRYFAISFLTSSSCDNLLALTLTSAEEVSLQSEQGDLGLCAHRIFREVIRQLTQFSWQQMPICYLEKKSLDIETQELPLCFVIFPWYSQLRWKVFLKFVDF
jgi:hypothetical protein